ncbi:MAG TPA: D-alanyl-D-alanine carboxypeptidase family protein, partial [Candidatus Limnocylindrales bacterium]|nr:D-alanyl-D-alanine carboxypeptidase family protein [Candidatus Limnocylindrales bacterium]
MRRKLFYGILVLISLMLTGWLTLYKPTNKAEAPTPPASNQPGTSTAPATGFNKQRYSIDQAGSLWWIVNKVRPLNPATYAPDDLVVPNVPLRVSAGDSEMRLRKEAAAALEKMVQAAEQDKISLMLASGYRSYQLQVAVYNANVQKYGQA